MSDAMFGKSPVLLDGGLATELEARGHDLSDRLWSARLLVDAPDEIAAAHLAYFRAGARIATTATYQASFAGFAAAGIASDRASELMARGVELADRARTLAASERTPEEPAEMPRWVAASVGPYGAMLADGSEYRGRYGRSVAELADFHRPRLEVLAAAGPDMLAIETIPDLTEALALVEAMRGIPIPAWLTYSVDGLATRAGQPLAEAFAAVARSREIVAVGVNCCAPDDVLAAVEIARDVTEKPVVAYPNRGEQWDSTTHRWRGTSAFRADQVRDWIRAGAAVVGGCCRVNPADITEMSKVIADGSIVPGDPTMERGESGAF